MTGRTPLGSASIGIGPTTAACVERMMASGARRLPVCGFSCGERVRFVRVVARGALARMRGARSRVVERLSQVVPADREGAADEPQRRSAVLAGCGTRCSASPGSAARRAPSSSFRSASVPCARAPAQPRIDEGRRTLRCAPATALGWIWGGPRGPPGPLRIGTRLHRMKRQRNNPASGSRGHRIAQRPAKRVLHLTQHRGDGRISHRQGDCHVVTLSHDAIDRLAQRLDR